MAIYCYTDNVEVTDLFAAFEVVRAHEDPSHPDAASAWTSVYRWIRERCGRDGDLHQETLLAVIRHRKHCEATEALAVAKWISVIYSRKRIDSFRRAKHDRALVSLDEKISDDGPVRSETIAQNVSAPHADGLLAAFVETTTAALLNDCASDLSAERRTYLRTQIRLALLRELLDYDLQDLLLEVPAILLDNAPLKSDRIYKWVERGRTTLLSWLRKPPRDLDPELCAALLERFASEKNLRS